MKRRIPAQGSRSSKKKPKDGIRRPLSAYNLYFKQVRPLLIEAHQRGDKQEDFDKHLDSAYKLGKSNTQGALFQAASRTLAERWKNMSPTERDPFERQAQEETKKYKIQLGELEMQKVAEEKAAAANAAIKAKEVPRQPPASVSGAGETSSIAATTNKGVRQQQSNFSDSENTTISSKSEQPNSKGQVFVQQPSVAFNISNNSISDGTSHYPASESNGPNLIVTSDAESIAANGSNSSNQQAQSDAVSRAIASLLTNQLAGGNVSNNNMAEDMIRKLVTAAVLESIGSDPTALLLVIVLLLQANANQPPPQVVTPPPPPPPENATALLLASLFQNSMQQAPASQAPPPQALPPTQFLQAPSVPAFAQQENKPDANQAALIENLSRLSEEEREMLVKIIQQGQSLGPSQSNSK